MAETWQKLNSILFVYYHKYILAYIISWPYYFKLYCCQASYFSNTILFLRLLGEQPAAIQSSGAERLILFSKPNKEKLHCQAPSILSGKINLPLSLLMFLVLLSSKVSSLLLQISSSPTNQSLTKPATTKILRESLQLSSERKRNVDAICSLSKSSLQNNNITAIRFHSSCQVTKSSWPVFEGQQQP